MCVNVTTERERDMVKVVKCMIKINNNNELRHTIRIGKIIDKR